MADPPETTFDELREKLYSAVVCDALDALGYREQSPRIPWRQLTVASCLIGRCKTTLWGEIYHPDPAPYELELLAVDGCNQDDVFIAAAAGSQRSGVWGELLTTAARNMGCVGAIVDGCVRDVDKMRALEFPVYARNTSPYDSKDRQRVTEVDVPVEMGGVVFRPGDLVVADNDGIVVVPQEVEIQVLQQALAKVSDENRTRDAIRNGMKATEAYRTFGVL